MPKKKLINLHLPLMPAPSATFSLGFNPPRCQFCGGRGNEGDAITGSKLVNGKRIPPSHKACLESAANPMFDLDDPKLRGGHSEES